MSIVKIVEENCTGCGACFESCPMDVLRLDAAEQMAVVAYPQDCIVCYNCERECPTEAIVITPDRAKAMPTPW